MKTRIALYALMLLAVLAIAGAASKVAFAGSMSKVSTYKQQPVKHDPAQDARSQPDDVCGLIVATTPEFTSSSQVYDVAVVSANNVWAVGYKTNNQTLVLHWDGTVWDTVASPTLGTGSTLKSIAVVSANDIWAVGYYSESGTSRTLAEHWNGTAWSVVASPTPGPSSHLNSVSATATDYVWAVGDYTNVTDPQTLTEFWNGTSWAVVASPVLGSNLHLNGVSIMRPTDVWAVGMWEVGSGNVTLIYHWDGTAWHRVISPNPSPGPSGSNILYDVSAVSASNAWAVGTYQNASGYEQTLVEHWDGTSWTVVASPSPATDGNRLVGVVAVGANDVWATGNLASVGSPPAYRTLVEHWNGTAWSVVTSPSPGTGNDILYSIAAVGPNNLWAVGSYQDESLAHAQPLVEHYVCTSCTTQFTDVPQGSTFYSYVRCLSCQSIVGGYTSSPPCVTGIPCFLPGSNVTRGQMAKFVSNAANYQDAIPPSQQTFTDVPPNSTFWLYVERVYLHNVVGGYTSSPPCTTGTPCFLPGSNVTRGQTAKFVAIAANYQELIPTSQHTFTDVPYGSPFWIYIERVYLHGVVNGYSTNPPCTGGVPCFLPGNAVSRGQTAKFISNTFFPNCPIP